MSVTASLPVEHLDALRVALDAVEHELPEVVAWGRELAAVFERGGKMLVAGNGGSAALAAHLTGELVGRFRRERAPLPAVWLGGDQAALTAIVNDYGADEAFARQVQAFARRGDVVVLLSTSGASGNVLAAAQRAGALGASVWAMTGARPNPLAESAHRVLAVPGSTATVQEAHQVLVHLVCEAVDECLA